MSIARILLRTCDKPWSIPCSPSLKNGEIWISFTLVASARTFAENEGLYRWLLQNQLPLRETGKFEKVEL